MKPITHREEAEHDWAQQEIPWLANRTLGERDTRRLRAHLEACAECRRDLAAEQVLMSAVASRKTVEYAPQSSYAQLTQRIDRSVSGRVRRWFGALGSSGRRNTVAFIVVAQAAALAGLAVTLAWMHSTPEPSARYALAGAPAPRLPHLQVIFAEQTSAADILAVLARLNGRVVGGPSAAGVYLVAIDGAGGAVDSAARALQEHPSVRFVAVVSAPPGE